MATNEKTSAAVAKIASKGLKNPSSLTGAEIKKLAASALTQASDVAKPAKKVTKKKAVKKKVASKPVKVKRKAVKKKK
jgi:hypothetical protein